jgi:hypothetical protein
LTEEQAEEMRADAERLRQVEAVSGVNIGELIAEIREMDPRGTDGACIFCKLAQHAEDCMYLTIGGTK